MEDFKWSDPESPHEDISSYDHVLTTTPIGDVIIEWKSWKDNPSYDITFLGGAWIGYAYNLDDAKEIVRKLMHDYYLELKEYFE